MGLDMAKPSAPATNGSDGRAPYNASIQPEPLVGSVPDAAASAAHLIAALRHDPAAIRRLFESGEYPYKTALRTAPYEAHMLELQRELLKAQRWVEQNGQRIILLFEGRDAAGKGGTIKRFT